MTDTTIPTECLAPVGNRRAALGVYAALAAVDTALLPDQAVHHAQMCQRWHHHRLLNSERKKAALEEWIDSTTRAIHSGKAPPSPTAVIQARNQDQIHYDLANVYDHRWARETGDVIVALNNAHDEIIEQLRPLWLSSLEDFQQVARQIPDDLCSTADLLNVTDGSNIYQQTRRAKERCSNISAARIALTRLPGRELPSAMPKDLLNYRNPEAFRQPTDEENSDALRQWINYRDNLDEAQPWLATNEEAINEFEHQRQAWAQHLAAHGPRTNKVWRAL